MCQQGHSSNETETIKSQLPTEYADFAHVFSEQAANKLPPHRSYNHRINFIPNSPFPKTKMFPIPHHHLSALKAYIKENLEKGFIEHSSSPIASPLFFIPKKNTNELRPIIDYREVNAITKKGQYPIPIMRDLLDRIAGAKMFTKFDLKGAYNLIRMADGEEWKTSFKTPLGQYQYKVMPFGLTGAPGTFQHFMNSILNDHINDCCVVYLDDILIYSKSKEEHIKHVQTILKILSDNSLYVKLSKSEFHVKETDFLGHHLSVNGISMQQDKINVIADWKPPQRLRQLQKFLGFTNFYRDFIPNYSELVHPLITLTKKGSRWVWRDIQQTAFERLKAMSNSSTMLHVFQPDLPTKIETDASNHAVGAVLSQQDPDTDLWHPTGFYSKRLKPAELNYHVHDKELLAILEH